MASTIDFIDSVKAMHKLPSDNAVAALLGLSRAQLSKYRSGKDFMSDATAVKVAELLHLDAGYVVACIHMERATTNPNRELWRSIANRLQQGAHALALAVFAMLFSGGPDGGALAATPQNAEHSLTSSDLLNCTLSRF